MRVIEYLRIPEPTLVLGGMYVLCICSSIFVFLKDGYWKGMLFEIKNIIIGNIVRVILVIGVILCIVIFLDLPVSNFCRDNYNLELYTVVDFLSSIGEGWFAGGFLFMLGLILGQLGYRHHAVVFKIAFMVSIFAGLINLVLKFVFNRERPVIVHDPFHFFHFFIVSHRELADLLYAYNSMPSGHTITVVSALTVFYRYYGRLSSKFILILIGLLIIVGRVYTLNHWLSDVLVSSLLGMIIGYVGLNINKKRLLR